MKNDESSLLYLVGAMLILGFLLGVFADGVWRLIQPVLRTLGGCNGI
jgi:hypothetical protein